MFGTSIPAITVQPHHVRAEPGTIAQFSVSAISSTRGSSRSGRGRNNVTLTYQWQRSIAGGVFEDVAGATGSSYSFTVEPTMYRDEYRCVISDGSVQVNSSRATLIFTQTVFPTNYVQGIDDSVLTRVSGGASWEDQDTRVNIKATLTSGINVLSGNYTDVIYTGETYDLDDSYDPTTGVFTPREAGYYSVMASLQWDNGNAANTGIRTIALTTASGTGIDRHDEAGSGRMYSSLHTVIYCDGVTGYKIRAWQNSGSSHGIVGSSLVNHSVLTVYRIRTQDPVLMKIDGGASWGKTETCVKAERSNSTTISTANYSTVRYANSGEEFDENGEFVPTTGLFTPVEAGYYVVKATINWENTNTQVGERTIRLVRNDGAGDEVIEEHAETGFWSNDFEYPYNRSEQWIG